jgi:hypothetical protein
VNNVRAAGTISVVIFMSVFLGTGELPTASGQQVRAGILALSGKPNKTDQRPIRGAHV